MSASPYPGNQSFSPAPMVPNETTGFGTRVQQVVVARPVGKTRSPILVPLFTLLTAGIYGIYWWCISMADIKRYRGRRGVGGFFTLISLLIVILALILPFIMAGNIDKARREAGLARTISFLSGLWAFLPVVGMIVFMVLMQQQLNRLWQNM